MTTKVSKVSKQPEPKNMDNLEITLTEKEIQAREQAAKREVLEMVDDLTKQNAKLHNGGHDYVDSCVLYKFCQRERAKIDAELAKLTV